MNKIIPGFSDAHKSTIMFCAIILFLAAFSIRCIYYVTSKDSPIDYAHLWEESDMNFFDYWATEIAAGDWWNKKAPHPFHTWHKTLAEMHFKANPQDSTKYTEQASQLIGSDSLMSPGKALIYDWYGGKTFHQEPLYAYLVALTYKITGQDVRHVFMWQLITGALSIVLIFLIGLHMSGLPAGIIGALLALLCGPFMFFDMVLLRTSLSGFITLALLYTLLKMTDEQKARYYLLFGLLTGIAMLNYSYYLLLGISGIFWALYCGSRQGRRSIHATFLFLAGLLMPLVPVMIRNTIVDLHPLALASNAGITFITANAKITDHQANFFIHFDTLYKIMNQTGGKALDTILATIETHDSFLSYLQLLWKKFSSIFMQFEIPNNINYYFAERYISILDIMPVDQRMLGTLGLAGMAGCIYVFGKKSVPILLTFCICLFPMIYFSALSRHRMPLLGVEAILAGMLIVILYNWMVHGKLIKSASGFITVLIVFFWIKNNDVPNRSKYDFMDYNFYYAQKYESELYNYEQKNDWKNFLTTTQSIINAEPEYIQQSFKNYKLIDYKQVELISFYSNMYEMHSFALEKNGKLPESQDFRKKGKTLSELSEQAKKKFKEVSTPE